MTCIKAFMLHVSVRPRNNDPHWILLKEKNLHVARKEAKMDGKDGNSHSQTHSFILMIHVESTQNIYCYSNMTAAAAEETKK